MLVKADLSTHIYSELITAIQRDDDTIINAAIAAAESEAKGYLSRYDTDALFAQAGQDRDPALLMRLKDMAAWHFITLANADINLEVRKTRYDEAKSWLKDVQSGKVHMKDWPLPEEIEPGDNDIIKVSSRTKRDTNW
jgi:phage gp36-like protein